MYTFVSSHLNAPSRGELWNSTLAELPGCGPLAFTRLQRFVHFRCENLLECFLHNHFQQIPVFGQHLSQFFRCDFAFLLSCFRVI
jgi:hypothetical protein